MEENLPHLSELTADAVADGASAKSDGEISILDLGGGAGAYSFPLAKKGYKVTLADLSETLLSQAKKQKEEDKVQNLVSCDQVNATDLSCYKDNSFDVVLLFGPLYHLTEKDEREKCIKEIRRVLKTGGDRLIQLCDSIAGAECVMDQIDRMTDVKIRYGGYDQEKWDINIKLKEYFEKKMGLDLYVAVDKENFRP